MHNDRQAIGTWEHYCHLGSKYNTPHKLGPKKALVFLSLPVWWSPRLVPSSRDARVGDTDVDGRACIHKVEAGSTSQPIVLAGAGNPRE